VEGNPAHRGDCGDGLFGRGDGEADWGAAVGVLPNDKCGGTPDPINSFGALPQICATRTAGTKTKRTQWRTRRR